ncbi:MAG: hypothetical protein RL077_356 [Verrucomicrobiota bacterium]
MGTTSTTFAAYLQKVYNPKLLETVKNILVLDQFALQKGLQPNSSSKQLSFRRRNEADLSAPGAPGALTEGVAPTIDRDVSYTEVVVTLAQRGAISKTTDVVTATELLEVVKDTVALLGEECALDADRIIATQLSDATTGLKKRYAGGATTFAGLVALTNNQGRLSPTDLIGAMTQLRAKKAPTIGGVYVAVLPPQVEYDILNHPDWKDIIKYQNADRMFKGEIGNFAGMRLVRHTNPFIEANTGGTEGTYSASGAIFVVHVLGKDAYGICDMAKLGGFKPKVEILDQADKSDPLNQKTIIGWKSYWGSTVLNRDFGVNVRCKSEFVLV